MKLEKLIYKYSFGKSGFECYLNLKNRTHGHYKEFFPSGNKNVEGYNFNDEWIGIWKRWKGDERRSLIDTRKISDRNGVRIEFNYEKHKNKKL